MKTFVVIMLIMTSSILIGLPFQNGSADNYKMNEPIWGKVYNQGASTDIYYTFRVQAGDNVTINIISVTGTGGFAFGLAGGGGQCPGYYLVYSSSSNDTTADSGYINFPLITVPFTFWIIPALEQAMCIHTMRQSSSSLTFSINKVNSTTLQDPAIKELQDQVKELQTNMTNAQTQIQQLTQQINALNSTVNTMNNSLTNMNNTQQRILENITNLWKSYDELNWTLNIVMYDIWNFSDYVRENFTRVQNDIISVQNNLSKLIDEMHLMNLQGQINYTKLYIKQTNENVTNLSATNANYDVTLYNKITQLQKENAQLRANIDTLNKTKNEKVIEKRADNSVSYGALALGIVALLVSIIALMSRKPRSPQENDSDKAGTSEDYEEEPKEIPKAKAKKSKKDEDLDDVMSKLKE